MECNRCGLLLNEKNECPQCGLQNKERVPRLPSGLNHVKKYFVELWTILTKPSLFFSQLIFQKDLALCFALITHWIGAIVGYIPHLLTLNHPRIRNESWSIPLWLSKFFPEGIFTHDEWGQSFTHFNLKEHLLQWFWGTGAMILDPFFTLNHLMITTFFIFVGAHIFISPANLKRDDRDCMERCS